MKTYRIIAKCDPYNARMHYNGEPVLKYDGAIPVRWVMDSGMSLELAKKTLWNYACQDMDRHSDLYHESEDKAEGIYSTDSDEAVLLKGGECYSYDVMTYMIEEE